MTKVSLYIYDISKGMARQLSLPILGKQIDGVWHTSIVCFGLEYFYGSDGISHCQPCGTVLGPPDETVNLGETNVTKRIFQEYLSGVGKESFRGSKYHLFRHNCNTFSNEVAVFLTGKKIPSYISDLPEEVMNTAFGAMMAQFFDSAVSVQSQSPPDTSFPPVADTDDESRRQSTWYDEDFNDEPVDLDTSRSDSFSSPLGLMPATYAISEELSSSIAYLQKNFKEYTRTLEKLRCILEEIEIDYGNEEETRHEVTSTLCKLCKELQSVDTNSEAFKSLLTVLKCTALNLSKIFKYAESDEITLFVVNNLQRGNVHEIKYLRLQFITNLLSVYELRNHLLGLDSILKTLVSLTVSSILDGPGAKIREAGCCLSYSLSIVKINEDHAFEISSALLHALQSLDKKSESDSRAYEYGMAALRNFCSKSDQVSELARMIVPDIESELGL